MWVLFDFKPMVYDKWNGARDSMRRHSLRFIPGTLAPTLALAPRVVRPVFTHPRFDMVTTGRSLAGASATRKLRVGVISLPGARAIGVGVGGRSLVS